MDKKDGDNRFGVCRSARGGDKNATGFLLGVEKGQLQLQKSVRSADIIYIIINITSNLCFFYMSMASL